MVSVDPLEGRMVRQIRIEKWISGKLIESQELTQHRTLYLPYEVLLMLQVTGFRQVTVRGDYTDGWLIITNAIITMPAAQVVW
jgi:hypothetical protein